MGSSALRICNSIKYAWRLSHSSSLQVTASYDQHMLFSHDMAPLM